MGPASVRDYIRAISKRYATATATAKRMILDEFCATTGYHRKITDLRQQLLGQARSSQADTGLVTF